MAKLKKAGFLSYWDPWPMSGFIPARFQKRYKRFFSDCRLDSGELVTAHCPNTGSMKTLLSPDALAYLRKSNNPKRKLPYTLVLLEVAVGKFALIDTALPNAVVARAVENGQIADLSGYAQLKREPRLPSKRRMDLLLEGHVEGQADAYVEVKNVTMLSPTEPQRADFPDAVTERGAHHLRELAGLAREGRRAVQFFLLGRNDCRSVGIAEAIDPNYGAALREAMSAGVELLAYGLEIQPEMGRIELGIRVPIDFR